MLWVVGCGLWVVGWELGGAVMLKAEGSALHNYFSWSRPILTWRMLIKVCKKWKKVSA